MPPSRPRRDVALPRASAGVRRRADRQRGSATLELVIIFPLLLAVVTAVVQFGLWFHARSLALVAAQEGVTAARIYAADPGAGAATAQAVLDARAGDTLVDTRVTTSRPATGQVAITVTGRALTIVPGVPALTVSQSAQGPLERFTVEGDP